MAVGDSSTARFGTNPHTFPVDAVDFCWAGVLQQALQVSEPAAECVVIAENGNTTTNFLPDGEIGADPDHNVTKCMTYYGSPPTILVIQFQVNPPNTPALNVSNIQISKAYAEGFGVRVLVCTPHPVLSASDPVIDELIAQRDLIIATFDADEVVDCWTDFAAVNGRDANPTYMLGGADTQHWNATGHALCASIVGAKLGL